MGKKDSVTIQYMRKESVFADIFNFAIYGGRPVLSESDLRDIDTRDILAYSVRRSSDTGSDANSPIQSREMGRTEIIA